MEPSETNNETKTSFSFSKVISNGKDMVALLRDLAFVVIFVLLLLFPDNLNAVFTKAGFEEGSILGMKWKKGILKSDMALKEALDQVTVFKSKVDSMNLVIAGIQNKVSDPTIKKQLSGLEKKNKELSIAGTQTQLSVRKTILSNAKLVKNAQDAVNDSGAWGVVYGGDITLKGAKYEVTTIAKNYNLPNAMIYHRQGSYRSVSMVDSREAALSVLERAKQRRPDAYIVPMSSWCPNSSSDKDGYLECAVK